MTDIANLTPEESFKAGLPVVLQLEAWRDRAERLRVDAALTDMRQTNAYLTGYVEALRKALALVTGNRCQRPAFPRRNREVAE